MAKPLASFDRKLERLFLWRLWFGPKLCDRDRYFNLFDYVGCERDEIHDMDGFIRFRYWHI